MTEFDYSTLRTVATRLRFPEGPIALDDGSLVVVEIEGNSIARITPDGTIRRFASGGVGPNGEAIGPDGALYVGHNGGLAFKTEDGIRFPYNLAADYDGGSIQRLDLASGDVSTIFTESGGSRIGGPNDLVFDASDGLYVVDTMRGVLHYADVAKGSIHVAAEGLAAPNGGGLSPDGTIFYVSETFSGQILALDVIAPGRIGDRRLLYSSGGAHGFDGLAVDGAGNVCAANLAQSGISVVSPAGELVGAFKTPEFDPFVTNICFGGPTGDTAYICSAGRGILYSIRWPWPGPRLNFAS